MTQPTGVEAAGAKKARKDRKHSEFTAHALAALVETAMDLGIDWVELRNTAQERAEQERALNRLPLTSGAGLARRGILPGMTQITDFELGRLSLLLEMMDAEINNPGRLISKPVYRKGQAEHGHGKGYEDERIIQKARGLGYFEAGKKERVRLRMQIIDELRLVEERLSNIASVNRHVYDTLKPFCVDADSQV